MLLMLSASASKQPPSIQDVVKPNQPINLFQLQYAATGKMPFMSAEDSIPQAGVTYIPPLTLKLQSKAPTKFRSARDMSKANNLPESFSWNNDDHVRKYKNDKLVGILMAPGNQYSCGSCWAWAVVNSVSDRIGIFTGQNPQLGPTYLLSWSVRNGPNNFFKNPGMMACDGGILDDALNVMGDESPGVKKECWSYDWCKDDDTCNPKPNSNPGMKNLNEIIPSFKNNKDKCISSEIEFKGYRVKLGSVFSFDNIESIKLSIFEKGPLPTGYMVFNDFMLGSKVPKGELPWKETKGIYIHLQPDPINPAKSIKGDPIFYTRYGHPQALVQGGGGHAVVIVGWGVEEFDSTDDNFMQVTFPEPHTKVKIPYWIARNSWSEKWGENGFFKIAMTNKRYGINTDILFDDNAKRTGGGPIEYDIDTSGLNKLQSVFKFSLPEEPDTENGCVKLCDKDEIKLYNEFKSYNDVDLFKVGVTIALICIFAFCLYMWYKRRYAKTQ